MSISMCLRMELGTTGRLLRFHSELAYLHVKKGAMMVIKTSTANKYKLKINFVTELKNAIKINKLEISKLIMFLK